jgi:hypothetical protein
MAKTATYCSECYNKVGRVEDAVVKAAEASGKTPMTGQGTCCKCKQGYDRGVLRGLNFKPSMASWRGNPC